MTGKQKNDDLARCMEFHGHLCPGLAVGIQASRALLARLQVKHSADEKLVAIVETDACGSDALQVLTGCTFGKGNLIWHNFGKHAFTLGDRKTGRAVRACLKPGVWAPGAEQIALHQLVQSGKASAEEKERFHESHREAARMILAAEPEDILKVEEVTLTLPPRARIAPSVVCGRCGEPVRVDFCREIGGQMVCPACLDK